MVGYFVCAIETPPGAGSCPLAGREDIGVRMLVPQTNAEIEDLPQYIAKVKLRMFQICRMVGTMAGEVRG
jgi:hypothetical protein